MTESVSMIHNKCRRQAIIWLIVAGIMAVLWLLVSLMNQAPTITKEGKKAQVTAEDFALPMSIDNLNELSKEVTPIDFETVVRDLRNYPAEFKGKKFFQDNEKRWTVQVMEEVEKNDVITAYLEGRNDRDKFAYFRYHNDNNEQRYILTYGIMGSREEALGAIKVVDFGLPKSMDNPIAVEIKKYVSIMDNYERAEMIVDSSEMRPRGPTLKETNKEISAEPKKEETKTERKTTTEIDATESTVKESSAEDELPKPPTVAPKVADNAKADKNSKKADAKAEPDDVKPESKTESKSELKPELKESKPELKSEKPTSTKEISVEDLPSAPPMPNTNEPSIPGDD